MKGTKPTIVVVTNVYFPAIGGISTYVEILAGALRSRGYDVQIRDFRLNMARKEEKISNRVFRRIVHELVVAKFTVKAMLGILALRLKGRRVIVHSQSASFCLGIGVFARLLGASTIHTFHSPIAGCSLRLKVLLPFAESIVCVSEEHRALYSRHCGVSPETPIVPGGVDCRFYVVPSSEEHRQARLELAEEFGLEGQTGPIVLFVGRVVKEKGVEVLLQAAETVSKVRPDAVFLVAGPLDESVAQIEQVRNLKQLVKPGMPFYLIGKMNIEWLRKLYRGCDMMVCPSLWEEGSPMVIAEALASGFPIVASGIGGLKSRIVDGVNGRLVKPGDSNQLAAAIIEILSNPAKMASMGRESRRLAVAKFSDEVMAERYERLYHELVDF